MLNIWWNFSQKLLRCWSSFVFSGHLRGSANFMVRIWWRASVECLAIGDISAASFRLIIIRFVPFTLFPQSLGSNFSHSCQTLYHVHVKIGHSPAYWRWWDPTTIFYLRRKSLFMSQKFRGVFWHIWLRSLLISKSVLGDTEVHWVTQWVSGWGLLMFYVDSWWLESVPCHLGLYHSDQQHQSSVTMWSRRQQVQATRHTGENWAVPRPPLPPPPPLVLQTLPATRIWPATLSRWDYAKNVSLQQCPDTLLLSISLCLSINIKTNQQLPPPYGGLENLR